MAAALAAPPSLEQARDRQDTAALAALVEESAVAASRAQGNADAQYRFALAASFQAEVALELKNKALAESAAKRGITPAERAISLQPNNSEYYRVLGTLCGQVIPANVLAGLSYGKRAQDAVTKAIEKDPKSSGAYLARGIGNYYLPQGFGGGPELAVADFRKAIALNGSSADAYLWLGLGLRKLNRNAEARQALARAAQLDPERKWIKLQLEKTPAK